MQGLIECFAYSALACFRDGDVGVGVFPKREEILVTVPTV